jgi:aspartate/methionine/tyrosine aminotransferase
MSFIANRLNYFDSSDFRRAVRLQQELENPIDLSIGVPEELTAEHVKAAGIKAIQEDKTTYTPANGILELRKRISTKLKQENKLLFAEPENISITPGLTTGQLLVYLATLNPGDEVIVFDPYYPPYPHLASTVGAHVVYISTLPTFQPDLPALEAAITNRTKMIVVNSPNNPTGAVYPENTLRKIAEIAQRHNLLVISDEIYEHYVYEGKHFSMGSIYENTITMNGFSKEFAMTGWRVGYICAPLDIIDAVNELQQYIVMSSSSIAQHAAVAAMHNRPTINGKYKEKRDFVLTSLREMGIRVYGSEGAYYAFFKAPYDMTDLEFIERAAAHNLILVPGRAFSKLHGFVRLSYGAELHELKRGILALQKLVKELDAQHGSSL